MRRDAGARDAEESFEVLLQTLTRQKEELRRSRSEPEAPARAYVKSKIPLEAAQIIPLPSTFAGSAKYSFGKPRHQKGKFKMQVLEPRDVEYVHLAGGVRVPGVGSYNLSHSDGHDLGATEGPTGGWSSEQHAIFLQTLKGCQDSAGPEFFDRVAFRLPGVPRKAIADHLRWLADHGLERARKQRRVTRWVRGSQTGEEPPEDGQRQALERAQARELHRQADLEEARSGLRDRQVDFQPHQCFEGKILEGNLRGHPEFRKPPGYTFGTSRELRDPMEKRHSHLSGVRSTSALDVPGPGHYLGLAEKAPLLERRPSAAFRDRLPPQKLDRPTPNAGPGYDGPLDAGQKLKDDLRATQLRAPAWAFGREAQRCEHLSNERKALRDKFSTEPHVGPAIYEHSKSMVSQY